MTSPINFGMVWPSMVAGAAIEALTRGKRGGLGRPVTRTPGKELVGKAVGRGVSLGGAGTGLATGANKVARGLNEYDEADRIEKGLVTPGEEDR